MNELDSQRLSGQLMQQGILPTRDPAEAVRWYRSSSEAQRGFCANCGSALFWQGDESQEVSVLAGSFDEPTGLSFSHHIYCTDKGDFYEITDGLPQYDRYPV